MGLINMNARMYDAKLGRFLQPDSYVQFPESTQGFNRYSYVENNPLSYTDPTGNFHAGRERDVTVIERDEFESIAGEIEQEEGIEPESSESGAGLRPLAESSKRDASRVAGIPQTTYLEFMTGPNSSNSNRTPEVTEIGLVGTLSGSLFSSTGKIPVSMSPENFKGGSVGGGAARLGIRILGRLISWLRGSRNARTALKVTTAIEAARRANAVFNDSSGSGDESGGTTTDETNANNQAGSGGNSSSKNDKGTKNRPPAGSKPIDKTDWSGDHQDIKEGIGAGPMDDTRIDPDDNVWGRNPDGSWTNHGSAGVFTGSGQPSGRTGRDRNRRR